MKFKLFWRSYCDCGFWLRKYLWEEFMPNIHRTRCPLCDTLMEKGNIIDCGGCYGYCEKV